MGYAEVLEGLRFDKKEHHHPSEKVGRLEQLVVGYGNWLTSPYILFVFLPERGDDHTLNGLLSGRHKLFIVLKTPK